MQPTQVTIVLELVRRHARVLRGEPYPLLRRLKALIRAREAGVPERYLLPFASAVHRLLDGSKFDPEAVPAAVGSLFRANRLAEKSNLAELAHLAGTLRASLKVESRDAILTGDGAALVGLYRDPGAFPGAHWGALLPDGTHLSDHEQVRLAPPAEAWSEAALSGDIPWRTPLPGLLVALLAAHLGNPKAPPTPSLWPHLGLGLLLWRDQVKVKSVLDLGLDLGRGEEVEHGLAIAAHVFPELGSWTDSDKLRIPSWEKKFAIPLAARRLLQGERD
ncbi:MAG: hypothetical protein JXP48_09735 [Acidobacteria bacterium]|nr:hypothetical protein [Acidobacteriota bacterium]